MLKTAQNTANNQNSELNGICGRKRHLIIIDDNENSATNEYFDLMNEIEGKTRQKTGQNER